MNLSGDGTRSVLQDHLYVFIRASCFYIDVLVRVLALLYKLLNPISFYRHELAKELRHLHDSVRAVVGLYLQQRGGHLDAHEGVTP